MNTIAKNKAYKTELYRLNWKKPASISVLLHVSVFALATFGLPMFFIPTEPEDIIIPVEMVDLDEMAQTPVVDEPDKNEEVEPPPPPKPVYNNEQTAPDLLSPKEPDIAPIEEEVVEEKVEDIPPPPKEEAPVVDPTEIKEPPKPKNKPRPKPKPEPKKEEVKKEEPKQEEERDISSLLKSLTPDEPQEQTTPKQETEVGAGQTSQIADYAKVMTRSELDDLNRGVAPCWNVQAGGRDAQKLVVKLRVFVMPNLKVRDVEILDSMRYNTDSHFKAAADAARWALMNPQCSTLRIPPEKYESYKTFIYNFDPSNML